MADLVLSGNTSGAITLSAPSVAGTNTITLPASTGTVLTTGSPQSGGVIQVVNGTTTTQTSSSSATWVDTTLTATITPKFSTSKILVLIDQVGCGKTTNDVTLQLKLVRNTVDLIRFESTGAWTGTATNNFIGACSCNYLDSPATTSAVTYKSQMSAYSPVAVVYTQYNVGAGSGTSTITLLEIAA